MTTREEQEAIWADVYGRMSADERRVTDDINHQGDGPTLSQDLQWAEELLALIGHASNRSCDEALMVLRSECSGSGLHACHRDALLNREPAGWAREMTPERRARKSS